LCNEVSDGLVQLFAYRPNYYLGHANS